jgi:hypothetical protein
VVWPSKCAACSLTHVGLAPWLSRIAGAIPPGLGETLRVLPGKAGTVLGMSALVVEYQKMQRELFEIVERFVVLNETAYRMLVADGSPAGGTRSTRTVTPGRVATLRISSAPTAEGAARARAPARSAHDHEIRMRQL